MSNPNQSVFISYRRSTSKYIARAIYQDLRSHGWDVFLDVQSIDSGQFDRIILNQIAARPHFVVILAAGSVERCDDPNDWLRCEIEHALLLQRNIVPLLIDEYRMEQAAPYLTGSLSAVTTLNSLRIPDEFFDEAMERLRTRYLKQPVYGEIQPTPLEDAAAVQQKIEEAEQLPSPTPEELTAEEYFGAGNAHQQMGELEEAVECFSEAIRLHPEFPEAYNNRGAALRELGQIQRAIADYDEAIRLSPDYANAYHNRALAYSEIGKLSQAVTDLGQAIALNAFDPAAYNNRGIALHNLGDLEGALADYNEAIAINPTMSNPYNNRGELYFEMCRYAEALEDFEQVCSMHTNHEMAEAGMSVSLHALGKHVQARVIWRKLLAADPLLIDPEYTGRKLNWSPALVEEMQRLIMKL